MHDETQELSEEDRMKVYSPDALVGDALGKKRREREKEEGRTARIGAPLERMMGELKGGRKRLLLKRKKPSQPGGENATMQALLERRTVGDLSLPSWYVERFKQRS